MATSIVELPLEVYPLYNPTNPMKEGEQIARSFEAIGTPEAVRVAAQFREGLTSIDAFGGMAQLESYYNGMLAEEYYARKKGAAPGQEGPMFQMRRQMPVSTPEYEEAVARNVAKHEANVRAHEIIEKNTIEAIGPGYDPAAELFDPDLDGDPSLFEDSKPYRWWDLVRPNTSEAWKLQIATDSNFPDLPFEERRKILGDNKTWGQSFRDLSMEAQNELIRQISDPELRLAPNKTAAARMLGVPLRPATAGEVVTHYAEKGLAGLEAGKHLILNSLNEVGTRGFRFLANSVKLAARTGEAYADSVPVSDPVRQVAKLVSMFSGESIGDSLERVGAWLNGTAENWERYHDERDLTLPGMGIGWGDDVIKTSITVVPDLMRLGLIHKALSFGGASRLLGNLTLPVDAYVNSEHLPFEQRKQAVTDAALLALGLRANAILETPMARKIGSAIVFGGMSARPHLDRWYQNPRNFHLDKFAEDLGPALAEGYLFERVLGARGRGYKLRERGQNLADATRILIKGQDRHSFALAFDKLSLPDKIAFSRLMTPHMRTVLRSGQRDLGMSVSGGAGGSEFKPPPDASETRILQQLAEEAPRRDIEAGIAGAKADVRFEVEGQWDPTIGEHTPEQAEAWRRGERALPIPQELQNATSADELVTQTARWVRGDGTFQDLLVSQVKPPTKAGEQKLYTKKDRAFELQPDPDNPPGFVSVYELAAKRRVRRHVEDKDAILRAHPKNKLQSFSFPDDPRVPPKWRGRTIWVGNQTHESITSQIDGNLNTSFKEAHDWYFNLQKAIPDFAADAGLDRLLTEAFAPSQQQDSPLGGMRNVFRAWEQMASGVFANGKQIRRAGVAHDQIMRALSGMPNFYRDAAKLADFSDLMYDAMPGTPRMKYRSAAGGDPRGLSPAAVDVHVGRARGWVDQKLHDKLTEVYGRLGDVQSLRRLKKLKVDNASGTLKENQYEESVAWINELSKRWDADGFHPEVRHYPGGAQAVMWDLGSNNFWASGTANSPYDAIHAHRRVTTVEVNPSDAVLGNAPDWADLKKRYKALTTQQQLDIAGTLGNWASVEVMNKVGIIPAGREVEHFMNAWDSTPNAGAVISKYPTAFSAKIAADALGYSFHQDEVWSWKAATSHEASVPEHFTTRGIALRIVDRANDALIDTDLRIQVYSELAELTEGLTAPGFTTTKHAGLERGEKTGITTIVDKEWNGGANYPALRRELLKPDGGKIGEAVRRISEKHGLDLELGYGYVDIYKARTDWKNDARGEETLRRIGESGRGDVAEWLVREFGPEYQKRFKRLIERAESAGETRASRLAAEVRREPTAKDFLRRNVVEDLDPNMPPVAPAYREVRNKKVVYSGRPGQLHEHVAKAHRLGPKAHLDSSLESGFVDLRTMNWLTRVEAEEFLPEWLKQREGRQQPRGKGADASDFQLLQQSLKGKIPPVSGGIGERPVPPNRGLVENIVVAIRTKDGKLYHGKPGQFTYHNQLMQRFGIGEGQIAHRGFVDLNTGEFMGPEAAEDRSYFYEERGPRRDIVEEAMLIPAVREYPGAREYIGVVGKDLYHADVMKRFGLDPAKFKDHGFVDASTGEWLTEREANKRALKRGASRQTRRIPGITGGAGEKLTDAEMVAREVNSLWKEGGDTDTKFIAKSMGWGEAKTRKALQEAMSQKLVDYVQSYEWGKAAIGKKAWQPGERSPRVEGGAARQYRRPFPRAGVGERVAKVYMPAPGGPGRRGIPTRGAGVPKWMNSTQILGPREQEFVETVLYREPGRTKLEAKRRGVMDKPMTEKMSEELATKWGVTPEQYMAASSGTVLTREQQMLLSDFYHAASETAREAEIDMRQAIERGDHAMVEHARQAIASLNTKRAKLLMTLYASRSEAGRTLGSYRDVLPKAERYARRALKMIMENEDLPQGARQRLVDRVINATSEAEVTRVILDAYRPTWWQKFTEGRIAFMLSSPITIGRNLIGNAAHVGAITAEQYTALPIDMLYTVGTKALKVPINRRQEWDRRHAAELFAMHFGQGAGLISGAKYALAIALDPRRPGDTRTFRQRIADAEANQAGGRIAEEANILPAIEGTKGMIMRMPFRLQAMGDVLFYEVGRQMKLYQLAMRNAMNGTPGAPAPVGSARLSAARIAVELAEQVPLEVRDAIVRGKMKPSNVTEAMAAEAHATGLEVTFRSPLGRIPQYVNSIRHHPSFGGKLANWVVPFFNTPVNVGKFVAQRAPLSGYVSPRNWKELTSGERAQFTNAVARVSLGTLLFAALMEKARNGYITGDAPNREMADQMSAIGRPYNSIIIPGAGAYDYRGFSPMSEFLAMAGNAAQREMSTGTAITPEEIYRVGIGIARSTLDQPFLTGVQDLSEAVQAPAGAEGDYKRNQFVEKLASSVVMPRGIAWLGSAFDPKRRAYGRAESLGKGIAMNVLRDFPLTRGLTPEYVDALGRSWDTPEGMLKAFVRHQSDEPISALDTWLHDMADPLRPDNAVIDQFAVKALGRIIGQGTRNEMHRRRGEILVPVLEKMRTDEAFNKVPAYGRRQGVEKAVRASSERIWSEVIPLWELDHLGMEAKPENVRAMSQIALDGRVARFYVQMFKDNSERRAFVEGVINGTVDLPQSILQQKVVAREQRMEVAQ